MIKEVDNDQSGAIEFPEFLRLMRQQMNNTNTQKELEKAFEVFSNDTETLNVMDLRVLLRHLCTDLEAHEVTELLMSAKPDGDGNIGYEQFVHMLSNYDENVDM